MRQAEERSQQILRLFRARELVTALTLIVALMITYSLWQGADRIADSTMRTAFDFRVQESNRRIQQRITVYEQILRATAGLFHATDNKVSRQGFRNFVNALSLAENYPGIQGIGFSVALAPDEIERHVAQVRGEGFPDYHVWPEGQRDLYSAILYLEPFTDRNLSAFGFDMFSNPTRQAAMALARDTGRLAVSAKVTLVQEVKGKVQSGFLIYLPLYRAGAPHDTLEQRRRNLFGWVYAPFRMDDFMHGLNGVQAGDLDIEIYDQDIDERNRMYDSDATARALDPRHPLRKIARIEARNHTWTVVTSALPQFEQRLRSDRPQLILQAGISLSMMVSLLIWLFLDDRARALQAAEQAMQLALYDALTGLPNRKLLDERLVQALANAKRHKGHAALLFIDLDRFKPVNDNYGHAYGDLLLKEVAKRLYSCMRESDTASRLGGDEFVALLQDIDGEAGVLRVADKILNQLTKPFAVAGHTFDISASIGAALYPEHGRDAKSLMKSADMAMYEAKNSGRSNVKMARAAA